MKTLIVGNWKLNPISQKEAKELFNAVKKGTKNKNAQIVICPPFVYLPLLKGLSLGAQNIFWEEKGAYTGEISATQLKDLNVEYVIVGHSERRKYFGETSETINKKITAALRAGLKVIFCIGEKEGESREAILRRQVTEGLKNISDVSGVVIAYEPVWAIGTGKNCSVEDTKAAILFIKQLASSAKVLYGGSVKADNAAGYIKEAGADGLLVGGASLDAEEFIKIVKSAT